MSNEIEQQQSGTEEQSAGYDRKQQILQQAVEIIAAEGYGKLSMRALARASGITLGALQYHFSTWEDMLRALNVYILDQYDKIWETMTTKDRPPTLQGKIGDRPRLNDWVCRSSGFSKKTVVCPRLHRLHWVQFVGGFLKPLD